jgi:hypothetical protein
MPCDRDEQMITIAIVAAVLVTGLIIVGVVVLRAGIAREEHDRSLLDEPATLAAAAARRIVGLGVRTARCSRR